MAEPRADSLVIGCVQMVSELNTAANLARCLAIARDADRRGVRLLVFPESASSRTDDPAIRPENEPLDGAFVSALVGSLADSEMTVVVGVTESTPDGRPFNTLVAFRSGTIIETYRKLHLYDAAGMRESDSIMPGDGPLAIFEVDDFRVGMMTCYDVRFPEISRLLAERGADVLAIPTSWVRGSLKEEQWLTLCSSRAIENTVYVAGAAQTGGLRIGRSAVFAPDGVVEAALGTEEGLIVTTLNRGRLDAVRAAFPLLAQRRFSIDPAPLPHPAARACSAVPTR